MRRLLRKTFMCLAMLTAVLIENIKAYFRLDKKSRVELP